MNEIANPDEPAEESLQLDLRCMGCDRRLDLDDSVTPPVLACACGLQVQLWGFWYSPSVFDTSASKLELNEQLE